MSVLFPVLCYAAALHLCASSSSHPCYAQPPKGACRFLAWGQLLVDSSVPGTSAIPKYSLQVLEMALEGYGAACNVLIWPPFIKCPAVVQLGQVPPAACLPQSTLFCTLYLLYVFFSPHYLFKSVSCGETLPPLCCSKLCRQPPLVLDMKQDHYCESYVCLLEWMLR